MSKGIKVKRIKGSKGLNRSKMYKGSKMSKGYVLIVVWVKMHTKVFKDLKGTFQ